MPTPRAKSSNPGVPYSPSRLMSLAHDEHRGFGADHRHCHLNRALSDGRPFVAFGQGSLQKFDVNHLPVWVDFSIPRCLPGYSEVDLASGLKEEPWFKAATPSSSV